MQISVDSPPFPVVVDPVGGGGLPAWVGAVGTVKLITEASNVMDDINPCPPDNCNYSGGQGFSGHLNLWTGGSASDKELFNIAMGGHTGCWDNGAYSIDVSLDNPIWVMRKAPSTNIAEDVAWYPDNTFASVHNYSMQCYIRPGTNGHRVLLVGAIGMPGQGFTDSGACGSFNLTTNEWDAVNFIPDYPGNQGSAPQGGVTAYDRVNHRVFVKGGGPAGVHFYDVAAKTWTAPGNNGLSFSLDAIGAIDWERRIMVITGDRAASARVDLIHLEPPYEYLSGLTYTGANPGLGQGGIDYDPKNKEFKAWDSGQNIRRFIPPSGAAVDDWGKWSTESWAWVNQLYTGVTVTTPPPNGTYGRFGYMEVAESFVTINNVNQDLHTWRV